MWQVLKTGRIKGNRSMQWEVWRRRRPRAQQVVLVFAGELVMTCEEARQNSQTSKQGTQGGGTALPRK
jgi:hypothetical protein